jgi:molecular chaperone GrpE
VAKDKKKEVKAEEIVEEVTETVETVEETSVVNEWEEKYNAERDAHLRVAAEFDNFRKRTIKEKMELVERGSEGAWKAVLPVLDDIERAVAASAKSEDIVALREGEALVMKKFESVLNAANITAIDCVGKPFNEEEQEAVARFAAGEDKRGLVIDCVQRGYKMGEHVLRYAKVVVGE